MSNQEQGGDLSALTVRVGGVERDISEVNDRILGLDTKIDKSISGLAAEFRTSFATISAQLSERQRTPWIVIFAAAGFVVFILCTFGSQALTPLQADIKALKEQIVPRKDLDYRAELSNRRFIAVEEGVKRLEDAHVHALQKRIDELLTDNRELKRAQPR